MTVGFGAGQWGSGPWGIGVGPLVLLVAEPKRENVVRLTFNLPVRFTKLLDPKDGSNPERFSVTPVSGTIGSDELPARDVDPIIIQQVTEAGAGGELLDVIVDRPFSPYPARYTATVNGLVSTFGTMLDLAQSSAEFDGLRRGGVSLSPDRVVERRDIANPQSLEALIDESPVVTDPALLATYPVDDTGDYATDAGIIGYKKRVYRRLFTGKGRFAHLRAYGVGVVQQTKRLGRAGVVAGIVADAEAQIQEEPDTAAASVALVRDPNVAGLWILQIRARMRTGLEVPMEFPFQP